MTVQVGVAILGCGHTPHAWSYARALVGSSTARLVGVYDEDEALALAVARDAHAPVHTDVSALVGSTDVDAVVVCSATVDHRSLVELAAASGCHVLCEKPIATTLDDARAMVDVCERAGVQLHSAFVSRFSPLVQQVRGLIAAGDLGDVVAMVGGNRGRPPLPPQYPAWITDPTASGGGALIDHSVHVTDAMRHVSGREAIRVGAEVGSLLWDCGVDDVALMSLVFEGGIVASVDPSWSVPEGNPWDYDFYLRILGTTGSLRITDTAESLHLVSRHTGAGLRLVPFGADIDAAMLEAFVASIRTGALLPPCASGVDGLRALEIALAGYTAADTGRTVALDRSVRPRAG